MTCAGPLATFCKAVRGLLGVGAVGIPVFKKRAVLCRLVKNENMLHLP